MVLCKMLFQEIKSSKIWEMKGYLCHWERTKYSSGNNMSSNISLWSSVDKAYSVIWREYLWLKEIGARKYYIINKVRRLWNMWEELVYRKKKRRRMGFGVKTTCWKPLCHFTIYIIWNKFNNRFCLPDWKME